MRKKCNIRLRRLTLWMLACLTAVCLLPVRTEEPTQPDQPENPTEPEKPGAGGKPSAGGTDPSAPGGSQSDGQTGPQGGTAMGGGARVLEGWAAQTGGITGEPGGGAGVLYFKKERDE